MADTPCLPRRGDGSVEAESGPGLDGQSSPTSGMSTQDILQHSREQRPPPSQSARDSKSLANTCTDDEATTARNREQPSSPTVGASGTLKVPPIPQDSVLTPTNAQLHTPASAASAAETLTNRSTPATGPPPTPLSNRHSQQIWTPTSLELEELDDNDDLFPILTTSDTPADKSHTPTRQERRRERSRPQTPTYVPAPYNTPPTIFNPHDYTDQHPNYFQLPADFGLRPWPGRAGIGATLSQHFVPDPHANLASLAAQQAAHIQELQQTCIELTADTRKLMSRVRILEMQSGCDIRNSDADIPIIPAPWHDVVKLQNAALHSPDTPQFQGAPTASQTDSDDFDDARTCPQTPTDLESSPTDMTTHTNGFHTPTAHTISLHSPQSHPSSDNNNDHPPASPLAADVHAHAHTQAAVDPTQTTRAPTLLPTPTATPMLRQLPGCSAPQVLPSRMRELEVELGHDQWAHADAHDLWHQHRDLYVELFRLSSTTGIPTYITPPPAYEHELVSLLTPPSTTDHTCDDCRESDIDTDLTSADPVPTIPGPPHPPSDPPSANADTPPTNQHVPTIPQGPHPQPGPPRPCALLLK
jgi:hypothetical protein